MYEFSGFSCNTAQRQGVMKDWKPEATERFAVAHTVLYKEDTRRPGRQPVERMEGGPPQFSTVESQSQSLLPLISHLQ